jgi:DNA-binding transcriptional LysR family regulator
LVFREAGALDIREAKYLLEIARTRHLTKAAENLFLTQPALSRVLKKLETEFEAPIFYREGNVLQVTPTGEIVLQYSENIVREYREMEAQLKKLRHKEKSELRVIAPMGLGFIFTPIIAGFSLEYPDIVLAVSELGGNDALKMMQEGKVDVIFPIRPVPAANYNEHLLLASELAVGMNASHPWATKEFIRDDDFENQLCVIPEKGWQSATQLENRLQKSGVTGTFRHAGRDLSSIMGYARLANLPILLPLVVLQRYQWPSMVIRKFEPSFSWELCCVYENKGTTTPALRKFVAYAMEHSVWKDLNGD